MEININDVICKQCNHMFQGYLQDKINAGEQYSATCPSCNHQVFFIGSKSITEKHKPDDAVQIMYVAQLGST